MLSAMRGLEVPEPSEDFTADQVELYFDLAYVFAFAQLVSYLHSEHTMLSIVAAGLLFVMLWLSWSQFTWGANAISSSARIVRVIFLIATILVMPMSASVASAFDGGGLSFGTSMALIYALALSVIIVAAPDLPGLRTATIRYSVPNYVAMVVIFASSFLDGTARTTGWIVGLLIMAYSILRAGEGEWLIRPGHFAERHGLIVIVALGEVIVAVGAPVVTTFLEGGTVNAETRVAVALAGFFAALLWWSYFDRPARSFEWGAEQLAAPRDRGRYARDVYTVGHAPVVFGVILVAAGLEEITVHPSDPLDSVFRAMLAIGVAAYLLGISAAVWRGFRVMAFERMVGLAAILAVVFGFQTLDGLTTLAVISAIFFVMLVVEHIRVESHRAATSPAQAAESSDDPVG
jgi:low temperature requirement protein LtrA